MVAAFNKLACTTCRSKKIKCNRSLDGCQHCRASSTPCVYAERRSRKPVPKVHTTRTLLPRRSSPNDDSGYDDTEDGDRVLPNEMHRDYEPRDDASSSGRLFVAPGTTRYINPAKTQQVHTLERVLCLGSDKIHRPSSLTSRDRPKMRSLLLEELKPFDLATSQPPPETMEMLWGCYLERVDPLVKVLYRPDVVLLIKQAQQDLDSLTPSHHALLFAIWFAATTAMSPQDCQNLCNTDRTYRTALGQSLLRANWMVTQDRMTLQAVVILLMFSSEQDSRHLWTMSGIAIGVAQAMGLHRDGTHFDLSPIETEVRRRLWWTLITADNRISDDCGLDVHAPPTMDTALPSNLNDADLDSSNNETLLAKAYSESTVTLIKAIMAQTILTVKFASNSRHPLSNGDIVGIAQATVARVEAHTEMLDTSTHMHQLCRVAARLIILKLSCLLLRHQDIGHLQQSDIQDTMLLHNVELLMAGYQLPECSFEYGWHFNCKSVQWHAMAYVLLDLSHRQSMSEAVMQASQQVQTIISRTRDDQTQSTSMEGLLWEKLIERAHTVLVRVKALPEHSAASDSASSLFTEEPAMPDSENAISGRAEKSDPVLEWLPDLPDYIDWAQIAAGIDSFEAWDVP